jgi:hypothetical protein
MCRPVQDPTSTFSATGISTGLGGEPLPTATQPTETGLNVRAVLGAARGHMILKQMPKAKLQLKRVLSRPWSLEVLKS